jgi:hypothetical protein
MGTASESSQLPSLQHLRETAAQQGVVPSDEDLIAVLGFLERILPALADLEERLPPETAS